jgi:ubiquinone/menaquinone biosynthesis C-methylase UbiE
MKTEISSILKEEIRQIEIPIKDGISMLLNDKFLINDNKKFMDMYNWMSRGYDIAETVIGRITYGNSINRMRSNLMSKLEWKNNITVLYVSIGTGRDLNFIPASIDAKSLSVVGLDISFGMLKQCRKNFGTKLDLSLFNCAAEELPFIDNAFDIVFHVGGINFFSDKSAAMKEMVRVAKPGTKILISDETSDWIESQFKKSRLSKKYFKEEHFDLSELESHIPQNVGETKLELMWENKCYCLTFRKLTSHQALPPIRP